MRLGDSPIAVADGPLAMRLLGKREIMERHRHRYEVSPQYIGALTKAGLVFSGASGNRMEICEIPGHPFFLATQFHPEFASRPAWPSPVFLGFVEACRKHRQSAGRGC
jgi:CTP synthase